MLASQLNTPEHKIIRSYAVHTEMAFFFEVRRYKI
jgi:hypothetical protein